MIFFKIENQLDYGKFVPENYFFANSNKIWNFISSA